jgi:endoglucanase
VKLRSRIAPLAIAAAVIGALCTSPLAASAADEPTGPAVFPGGLYHEAKTQASIEEEKLRTAGNTASADLIHSISSQPTAVWVGDWYSDALLKRIIARHVAAAKEQGTTLVFATYAIPNRDCGGYSAGGFDKSEYLDWNRTLANALAGTKAVVLIEPDSLAMLASAKCAGEAATRLPLLAQSVEILEGAGLSTYLDGGNSRWLSPADQAAWLSKAGIAKANGFFTNVSNFNPVQAERDYAGRLSSRVGWKHFVIDTSRNGAGWTGTWCNPPATALGRNPNVVSGTGKLDALLWVKHPGSSDGSCNGGPAAGSWFERGALEMVRKRG